MKDSDRKPTRVVVPAGLLMGLLCCVAASAADTAKPAEGSAVCREETRRVAVWPQGGNPKFNQHPRFEKRLVTVCDGKVVPKKPEQRSASSR